MEKKIDLQKNEELASKKRKKWVVILIFVILLIVGGLFWFFASRDSEFDDNAHSYNDPIKKGTTWTPGQLVFPGFGEVTVGTEDKEIKITLGNSKINEAYFKYKVVVEQEGKNITILDTKLIKPGEAITEIPTDKLMMKKGTYPMKITANAYSLKNSKAPLNGSTVDAKLVID